MKKQLAATLAAAGVALFALSGCVSSTPPGAPSAVAEDCKPKHAGLKTLKEGVLTIAQYDYAPFSASEKAGELTGLEGDILTKFAKDECLTIQINKGESPAMITSVSTGRADTTLGSWYRTAERAKAVRLSAPVITSPFSSITKKGIDTVDGLKAVKLGVGQGLIGVDAMKKVFGNNLKIYQNDDAVFDDIKAGRIDGSVQGYIAGNQYLKKHEISGYKVTPLKPDSRLPATKAAGQTNFPVNKNNESLGMAIDEVVAEMRKSGELDKIAEKYDLDPQVMHLGKANLL